jgi:Holliday junction resolvasome RuvABC endonuclease subunit
MPLKIKIKKVPKAHVFEGQEVLFGTPEGMKPLTSVSDLKPVQTSALTVIGLDVSTDTGVVVLSYDAEHQAWRTVADFEINLPSLPKTATMVKRTQRCLTLRAAVNKVMVEHKPQAVAIEGYGYANAHSLVTLVEFGASVRSVLTCLGAKVALYEVAPAALKKFILGKGVGPKEQVMMQVFKRYGYEAATNNLADAYVLAQMAAALCKAPPGVLTKPQVEVLAAVKAKNA